MKRTKYYFSDIDEEMACTKEYLIDEMKEQNISELNVSLAEREVGVNYYFCKAVGEVGERGKDFEPCGKECETYEPRNGKSGCCKYRGFCYEPGKEFILNINGKLKEV
jgi:hypothetical protein